MSSGFPGLPGIESPAACEEEASPGFTKTYRHVTDSNTAGAK